MQARVSLPAQPEKNDELQLFTRLAESGQNSITLYPTRDLLREELSLSQELSLSVAGSHCLTIQAQKNPSLCSGDLIPRQHAV